MKNLNEREEEEIASLAYYIKYLNLNPDVKDYEIWDGLKKLQQLAKFLVEEKELTEEDDVELLSLDDVKTLIDNFFFRLNKKLLKEERHE